MISDTDLENTIKSITLAENKNTFIFRNSGRRYGTLFRRQK
jgi:hypothetical protein